MRFPKTDVFLIHVLRKEVIPKEVDVTSIRRQIAQMMVATIYVKHKEERATLKELFCSNSGSNNNDC